MPQSCLRVALKINTMQSSLGAKYFAVPFVKISAFSFCTTSIEI